MANKKLDDARQVLDELEKELSRRQSVVHETKERGSMLEAISTMGRQGLSFMLADEIDAAKAGIKGFVTTPGSIGERAEGAKVAAKSSYIEDKLRRDSLREQYPWTSFLSEGAGGGVIGGSAFNILRNQVNQLPLLARLPLVGAAEGALFGAGQADPGSRLRGAATGAVVGGVATPFVAGAGVTAMSLMRPAARRLGDSLLGTPRDVAVRRVREALDADDITPQEADALLRQLGPDAVLADLGDTLGRHGRVVTSQAGPAASRARRFLDARQQRQHESLKQSARRATGSNNFDKGITEIVNGAESRAGPIYDEVFSEVIDMTPAMKSLMDRPALISARRKAANILKNEGFSDDIINDVSDVRYMDAVKRALDDQIGAARRSGNNNQARILTRLKNEFVSEIDAQVPRYAEARATFAGEQGIREAAEFGRTMFSNNRTRLADIGETINQMGPSELEAARMGFLDWMAEELGKQSVDSSRMAAKFAETGRFNEMARMLFPDQNAVDDFVRTASAQSRFSDTRRIVTGGSPTERIKADRAGLSPGLVDTVIDSAVSPTSALSNAIRLIRGNTRLTPEVVEAMGDILFNPNVIPSTLRVNPALRPFYIPRMNPAASAGTAGGILGSQAGPIGDELSMDEFFGLLGK